MLGHKLAFTDLSRLKLPSIFSDHNALKLEINRKKKVGKTTNVWRLNNMPLKNNQVKEGLEGEIKTHTRTHENDNMTRQNLESSKSSSKREVYIALQAYIMKQEKSQINNLILQLKDLEKKIIAA